MAQLASIDVEVGDFGVGDASRAGEATSPVLGPAVPQAIATQKTNAARSAMKGRCL
jgi:hypothetical protein